MKIFEVELKEVYTKKVYVEVESEEKAVDLIEQKLDENEDSKFFAYDNYNDYSQEYSLKEVE